jgi:hypothetical protein
VLTNLRRCHHHRDRNEAVTRRGPIPNGWRWRDAAVRRFALLASPARADKWPSPLRPAEPRDKRVRTWRKRVRTWRLVPGWRLVATPVISSDLGTTVSQNTCFENGICQSRKVPRQKSVSARASGPTEVKIPASADYVKPAQRDTSSGGRAEHGEQGSLRGLGDAAAKPPYCVRGMHYPLRQAPHRRGQKDMRLGSSAWDAGTP